MLHRPCALSKGHKLDIVQALLGNHTISSVDIFQCNQGCWDLLISCLRKAADLRHGQVVEVPASNSKCFDQVCISSEGQTQDIVLPLLRNNAICFNDKFQYDECCTDHEVLLSLAQNA